MRMQWQIIGMGVIKVKNTEDWLKIITVEQLNNLKNDPSFNFCRQNLYKEFGVSQKMLEKILKILDYEVPRLTKNKQLSTEEWVKQVIDKRGDIYDYTLVDYKNSSTKVKIICRKHGLFTQTPAAHYSRLDGCPLCGKEHSSFLNRTTKEDFIRQSNLKHKNKFDYSLVCDFKNLNVKLKIICPKHGVFEQNAQSHKRGSDCEKCSYEKRGANYRYSKEDLLSQFSQFGSALVYDLSNYTTIQTVISYTCPTHGLVKQSAAKHLRGEAVCSKCAKRNVWNRKTTEEFIESAKKVHKDYYDYSKSVYINNRSKVIITCKYHGDFSQKPNSHIEGKAGCPTCAIITSNIKDYVHIEDTKHIDCSLYLLNLKDENNTESFLKIGISRYTTKRMLGIKADSIHYYKPELLKEYKMSLFEACALEQHLHKHYKKHRYKPKQYFKGHTECFSLDDNTVHEYIIEYLTNLDI